MKRLTLIASLLVLGVVAPATLHAQASVQGTVSDAQTGQPLGDASVATVDRSTDKSTTTTTNDAGVFSLKSPAPIRSVIVSRAGYVSAEIPVADASRLLHVRLEPSRAALPGVRIVGNASAPGVSLLSSDDLDRSSGLSLENSINTVPGVFMQSRTPWGGARITIRGYYPSTSGNSANSNGLGYEVFMNNIPVTDATGATILDDIDYSTLGNVEIIKGPASSLYGSQIGGAVKLTTARASAGETSFGQQVMAGSFGLVRTNSTFQTGSDNSDIVLNYGHQSYGSFRPHSASNKDFARAIGDFNVSDRQSLSTYFAYSRSFEELAGEIDSTDYYNRNSVSNAAYVANDSHIQITSFVGGVTDNYRIGDSFTSQTTLFGNGRSFAQPFAHGFTNANQFSVGVRTSFGYSGSIGSVGLTGTVGGSLQRTNITTNGVFIVPAPPYTERPTAQENYATNGSLFTEWSFALPRAFNLTAGASLNRNQFAIRNMLKNGQLFDTTTTQVRKFDAVLTPRVALSRAFGPSTSLYASVSAGYTPPLLSNVISNTGAANLALKPERAVQYEIGGQTGAFDDRLSLQAALFDIENTDKLVSQTSGSVTFTMNAGKQRNRGAELSLNVLAVQDTAAFVSLLRPWASYSYTDATFIDFKSDNNANAKTMDYSGNAVPRVPRNMFSTGVDASSISGVYANGSYRYVGSVPLTFDNSTYVRSYDMLGAKVGYRHRLTTRWDIDAFAGGDNVLGHTKYSFLFVGPTYAGLAQAKDGGTGDGYIIPAPYSATFYSSVRLSYRF